MGYEVHITRASHWTDSKKCPISLDEWDAYIQKDPEMRRDDVATASAGEDVLSCESDGLAVWLKYSKNEPNVNLAWFEYGYGRIVVKNPDEEILGKMKRIAAALNANVIGDEGEEY